VCVCVLVCAWMGVCVRDRKVVQAQTRVYKAQMSKALRHTHRDTGRQLARQTYTRVWHALHTACPHKMFPSLMQCVAVCYSVNLKTSRCSQKLAFSEAIVAANGGQDFRLVPLQIWNSALQSNFFCIVIFHTHNSFTTRKLLGSKSNPLKICLDKT